MARRKKGAVRRGHGVMCNICGKNCGKGGALKTHVEGAHAPVTYEGYKICFYGEGATLADTWNGNVSTSKGKPVLIHTLVRRIVQEPGKRGATQTVRKQSA